MKILFLGELRDGQTSRMRMRALQRLGHDVIGVDTTLPWIFTNWFNRQFQRRLQFGPIVTRINNLVIDQANNFVPDLVWAEKQEFLKYKTLELIHKLGARSVHFTPDPYFSIPWKQTRIMNQAIPYFSFLAYCKKYEEKYYKKQRQPSIYVPLGFCDEVHRPFPKHAIKFNSDVTFIGGWEPTRQQLIEKISSQGTNLKIWGAYWDFLLDGRWTPRRYIILRQLAGREKFKIKKSKEVLKSYQSGEIYGDEYAQALTSSKISLGLLRKTWPDQHTTRSFEIPACGSLLLAERTDEHCELFDENKEAMFFSSRDEAIDKLNFLLSHETDRIRIAEAGYQRCIKSNYSYLHIMKKTLSDISVM